MSKGRPGTFRERSCLYNSWFRGKKVRKITHLMTVALMVANGRPSQHPKRFVRQLVGSVARSRVHHRASLHLEGRINELRP